MKRKALLKDGKEFSVLEESDFSAETELQEALKRNPTVIPAADLDLGEVVVVGRETSLPVGAIDLLLVDAEGRVIILETKLSRNPELRRQVVAQLLDYGASLWRTAPTLKRFEELVLRYWHSAACEDQRMKGAESLREGLEPVFREQCGEQWDYEAMEAALEENLSHGQHVMLIVASGLMDGLSRDLLQYAGICLHLPLYGVEIDVFETGAKQLIVPRGVRHTAPPPPQPPAKLSRGILLSTCSPVAATFFTRLLNEAEERDMIVYWGFTGFSVRLPLEAPVTVMYGYRTNVFVVYLAGWPIDIEREKAIRQELTRRAPFRRGGKWSYTLSLDEQSQEQARSALEFVWDEVGRMMQDARKDA